MSIRPLKALVLDDNEDFARSLAEAINIYDPEVEVRYTDNAFDAGLIVASYSPNVILLDLVMPGIDGYEICKKIKADAAFRHINIIAMTGFATPKGIARIKKLGASECLIKPFEIGVLVTLLRNAFEQQEGDHSLY